jgi:tetratricopeptide (TPR) repeat protein
MIGFARAAVFSFLACAVSVTPAFSQGQTAGGAPAPGDSASAYYNFAMGHLYAELAGSYGNRGEYVNKAIDFYREAMRIDPSAAYIAEELTEFYVQTGQLEKATTEANNLLKANPANIDARKILARIYARQIGDPDQGRIDQDMLKNAIAQYQQITQQDPKDTESLSTLARLYRVSRDDAAAEKAYRQVLALDAEDEDALNGLALVLADHGDMPGAIEMLKKVVEKNPDPRTVVMLAEFYDQSRDFTHGADTWKQVVALTSDRDNSRVRARWAADLYQSGRLDEALEAFRGLAADDPKNVALLLQMAEIQERKNDFTGAAATLAKARALGNTPDVRFAEAQLLQVQGKNPQAISALQSLLTDTQKEQYNDAERGARLQILDRLATAQQDSGKTPEAIQTYRQITDLDPALGPRVELQIVEALKTFKDFKAARQESDSALKKYPSDRSVAIEHALLLGELGQTDPAINELKNLPKPPSDGVDRAEIERAVLMSIAQVQDKGKRFDDEKKTLDAADALSKTSEEKQTVQFTRGAMYERSKNFDMAEQTFRAILQDDPNSAGALNYLGYMYADRNIHLEEAQQMISKALEIDPGNGAYLDSLGWVHFRLNHLDQAATELRQALDKTGKDPTVHDHLAEVYFKQGKIREAIQQWEASVSEWKTSSPTDQDPVELAKVTKKLEGAKVRVTEKR